MSPNVFTAYSFTIATAFSSLAVGLGIPFLVVLLFPIFFLATGYSLNLVNKSADKQAYHKQSEQIAMVGIIAFLPLIFTLGIFSALLVFLAFAQLALNLQTYKARQGYLGLVLSFAMICTGAIESKSGWYLLFFIPYSLGLSASFLNLSVQHNKLSRIVWFKSSFILCATAFVIYLLTPRFEPLLFGATHGSDHYYHDKGWEKRAENPNSEEGFNDVNPLDERDDLFEYSQKVMDESLNDESLSDEERQAINELKGNLNQLKNQLQDQLGESGISNDTGDGRSEGNSQSGSRGNGSSSRQSQHSSQRKLGDELLLSIRSGQMMYLRTRIYDSFDGSQWNSSNRQVQYVKPSDEGFINSSTLAQDKKVIGYEVHVEHDLNRFIPLAAEPTHLYFPATTLKKEAFNQFSVPEVLKKGSGYNAEFSVEFYQGRMVYEKALNQVGGQWLQLDIDIKPLIQSYTVDLVQNLKSPYEKAQAIENHLRTEFQYTLDTALTSNLAPMEDRPVLSDNFSYERVIENDQVIEEFLFETQYGHCELFATSMVLMLRSIGISARYVNGYSATDVNPVTGYIEVSGLDAHAWVEAYIDGIGWMPFEPTAFYQVPSKKPSQFAFEEISEYANREISKIEFLQPESLTAGQVIAIAWRFISDAILSVARIIYVNLLNISVYVFVTIALLGLIYFLCPLLKPWINKYILRYQVQRYRPNGTITDYQFYFDAIMKAQEITKTHSVGYAPVTLFTQHLGIVKAPVLSDEWLAEFNLQYSKGNVVVSTKQIAELRKLFDQIIM